MGGFGAGAAGAGISPIHARDYRFRQEQLPRLEKSRADYERGQDRKYKLEKRSADLEGTRARTAATIAGMKDADLERQYRRSQIERMNAQTEAQLRGKDVVKKIPNPETGEIEEIRFFADGTTQVLGKSGDAILKRENYEHQDKRNEERIKAGLKKVQDIADRRMEQIKYQEGQRNYRTGLSQAGQNERTNNKIKAQYGDAPPVGSVPNGGSERRQAIIRKAIEAGYTAAQAAAEADKRGIK